MNAREITARCAALTDRDESELRALAFTLAALGEAADEAEAAFEAGSGDLRAVLASRRAHNDFSMRYTKALARTEAHVKAYRDARDAMLRQALAA